MLENRQNGNLRDREQAVADGVLMEYAATCNNRMVETFKQNAKLRDEAKRLRDELQRASNEMGHAFERTKDVQLFHAQSWALQALAPQGGGV